MKYLQRSRSFLESPVVIGFLLVLASLTLYHTGRSLYLQRISARENADIEAQIKQKEEEIQDLESKLQRLKSGEGVELEARGRLNLQKPDERVLIITEEKDTMDQQGAAHMRTGIIERLKAFFGF